MRSANKVSVLKRPIVIKPKKYRNAPNTAEAVLLARSDVLNQNLERVIALLQRGLGRGDSADTTIAVIEALIEFDAPGFRVEFSKKRETGGRPPRWGAENLMGLWYAVRLVMERDGCKGKAACERVFVTGLYDDVERPTTLLRRFHEAKKSTIVKQMGPALEAYGFQRFSKALEKAVEQSADIKPSRQ